MINEIIASNEERLKKSIDALKREFGALRAGRATPSLLDKVMVDYYGRSSMAIIKLLFIMI